MRKIYMIPQVEEMTLSAKLMDDSMAVIAHSGGGGFTDEELID